ncbi:UPF0047 protein YjbQ [Polistes fuscatus]|uniref:UPF0047 protein YjbQ n=1 Tax=Polistes fuscatus TaxID=30207 RepID=UPI001CA80605|nr:UPF0047 protein YjbQ [Polistes fuscatus]
MASSNRGIQIGSAWYQTNIKLRPQHRGIHLVTEEILKQIPELYQFSVGLCHIQILHTSASLALNESWDPDVRDDIEMMLINIAITNGKLALGTWQGIWFCEHRDNAGSRKLIITLTGCLRDSARTPLSPVSPIASTSS